jgi:flagellar biogenesis protein FliO
MGITEIEALALILGGAYLVVGFKEVLARSLKEIDLLTVFFIGGLAMLLFGLLDIAVDHL